MILQAHLLVPLPVSIKVYVDPYSANVVSTNALLSLLVTKVLTTPYDAGLYSIAPYVPLQQVRASTQIHSNPKLDSKTRYGMVSNPFARGLTQGSGALTANTNKYRRVQVANPNVILRIHNSKETFGSLFWYK